MDAIFQYGRLCVAGVSELRGNGQLINKEVLLKCGSFNENTVTDDLDLSLRLLLSISTLILTYTQIKSGKRFIGSLGWSVTFLSIGLIFGGLLENNSFIQEVSNNSLSIQKIQSIPAMVILWLGVIFL